VVLIMTANISHGMNNTSTFIHIEVTYEFRSLSVLVTE
jgi:hypothetical protein